MVCKYDGGNLDELGMKVREIVSWDLSAYTDSYLQVYDKQEDLLSMYGLNDGIKENVGIS